MRIRKIFSYLIYYAIIAIIYLSFVKMLQSITGIANAQSDRGKIVLSINQLLTKFEWFINKVLPQSLSKIVSVFAGNALFKENNMFYGSSYNLETIGSIITIIILLIIAVSIVDTIIKQKSIIIFLIMAAAVPLSFWPFLILPESYFVTYYALGTIWLLFLYFFDGIYTVFHYLLKYCTVLEKYIRNNGQNIVFVLIAVVILQSNNYAENAWVNYSRDSYEYIANSIASEIYEKDEINKIIVKGNMSAHMGRPYIIYCVRDVLKELGYNSEKFEIIQQNNDYYISSFSAEEAAKMKKTLGDNDFEKLLQYYEHDDMYNMWRYVGGTDDLEVLEFLQSCFIKTNHIILNEEDAIYINLNGFKYRNKL